MPGPLNSLNAFLEALRETLSLLLVKTPSPQRLLLVKASPRKRLPPLDTKTNGPPCNAPQCSAMPDQHLGNRGVGVGSDRGAGVLLAGAGLRSLHKAGRLSKAGQWVRWSAQGTGLLVEPSLRWRPCARSGVGQRPYHGVFSGQALGSVECFCWSLSRHSWRRLLSDCQTAQGRCVAVKVETGCEMK